MAANEGRINEYFLSRDFVDLNRLNLQHYLYKDIFGYSLHTKIPREGIPNLKIADVGTGTGVWLKDLSVELDPSTQLIGLDTNTSQAGPPQWLPSNVTIRQWDATTDVPSDLVGQFDIVNIRLFGLVIREDPAPVLRNLIKMLKETVPHKPEPNGHIQWCETDQQSWRIQTATPSLPTPNLAELWRQTGIVGSGVMAHWVDTLPRVFEAEGLRDVVVDRRTGDPHTLLAMHWCNMNVYEMFERKLRPVDPEKADELVRLIQGGLRESEMGAMFVFDRINVVGRKAA
ncbi:hypothetical protein VMCG_03407 [Cytospora schulzeri]|uniref:Methyltransferase domain-containing protein n=1 Tax=Cytospora schulzeri TaxID=448051 RepID=A0A423WWU5_9PEZI|nr:hypothetical protein VMCG_03407 [Valsa malicola]